MIYEIYFKVASWLNNNPGVLTLGVFLATLLIGWSSGILSALRRKPKLVISTIEGPTFVCTYGIGGTYEGYDAHRTGVALYLKVSNVGSAPTSIANISIGYRWAIMPFKKLWWRYGLFRFWLSDQVVALDDFQAKLSYEKTKVYPFLTQSALNSGKSSDSFVEVGKSVNGVLYFEQDDSYGACFPVSINKIVNLRIAITDVYGKIHKAKAKVPKFNLEQARFYNPSFASTITTIRGQDDVFDLPIDENGNLIAPIEGATSAKKI